MPVATALWKSIDGEMKLRYCVRAFDSSFSTCVVIVESESTTESSSFPFDIYSCGVLLIFLPHKREQIVS